jgi:outer membrane protein TolC
VSGAAGAPSTLTLDDAVARALARSHVTRIAAARADERLAIARAARTDLLPRVEVSGQWFGNTGTQRIGIPQGALGMDATDRPVPFTDRVLEQNARAAWFGLATVSQPLTPLLRIRAGVRAADAAARQADAARDGAARDIALGVEKLYLAALIADRRATAARLAVAAGEARHTDAARGVQAGFALAADRAAARAGLLDAQQAVLAAEDAAADARADLALLVGLDPDAPLALLEPDALPRLTAPPTDGPDARRAATRRAASAARVGDVRAVADRGPEAASDVADLSTAPAVDTAGLGAWIATAHAGSPELRLARAQMAEAAAGVAASRAAWIPDVALYGQLVRQNVTSIVGRQLWTGGVRVAWTAWDFGRRGLETEAAAARARAAAENAERVDEELAVAVRRAWRAAVRAERRLDAAEAAATARADAARIAGVQAGAGLTLVSAHRAAAAAAATADADRYAALLGVRMARAELRRLVGGEGW